MVMAWHVWPGDDGLTRHVSAQLLLAQVRDRLTKEGQERVDQITATSARPIPIPKDLKFH